MNLKFRLKTKIMQALMEQHRKKPFDVAECDKFQLPGNAGPLINNSYFFGGNTVAGQSLIMRIAYRNTGFVELFVIYCDVDGRFLTVEKQSYPTAECPLKVSCTIPGKAWHLHFDGRMVDAHAQKTYNCVFDVDYNATLEPFSALHHSDFRGMAEAFAREKWNGKFFKALSGDTGVGSKSDKNDADKLPQLHYEQTGRFTGEIQFSMIDGSIVEHRKIDMTAARDHSFGKRDWNFMNDHIWLLMMTDNGEVLNFSIVNYPHVKRIFCGYSNFGDTENRSLIDYRILSYDHNEGKGSDSMTVECTFAGGKKLTITSHRVNNVVTPFDNGNYYFQEGVGTFDVGGVPARGSIEYGFNKDKSRWDAYQQD